jgi:hypothetical protein
MASTLKDLTDSAQKFVVGSLDNMKHMIDRSADEVKKTDMIGAGRRIADQFLEGTKETVCRVADSAGKADAVDALRCLATGTLDNVRDTVQVASEESQRINLVETGSKVSQEALELMRRQIELGFDTGREVGQVLDRVMPVRMLNGVTATATASTRPAGVVTRVEIESDKGTIKTETAK